MLIGDSVKSSRGTNNIKRLIKKVEVFISRWQMEKLKLLSMMEK